MGGWGLLNEEPLMLPHLIMINRTSDITKLKDPPRDKLFTDLIGQWGDW